MRRGRRGRGRAGRSRSALEPVERVAGQRLGARRRGADAGDDRGDGDGSDRLPDAGWERWAGPLRRDGGRRHPRGRLGDQPRAQRGAEVGRRRVLGRHQAAGQVEPAAPGPGPPGACSPGRRSSEPLAGRPPAGVVPTRSWSSAGPPLLVVPVVPVDATDLTTISRGGGYGLAARRHDACSGSSLASARTARSCSCLTAPSERPITSAVSAIVSPCRNRRTTHSCCSGLSWRRRRAAPRSAACPAPPARCRRRPGRRRACPRW